MGIVYTLQKRKETLQFKTLRQTHKNCFLIQVSILKFTGVLRPFHTVHNLGVGTGSNPEIFSDPFYTSKISTRFRTGKHALARLKSTLAGTRVENLDPD